MKLPKEYVESMQMLLGDEFDSYLKSFDDKRVYGLRVNTSKISCEEFEKICPFDIKPIPWIKNGYFYDEDVKPAKNPLYFAGLYYIQEPSAMTPANRLPIEKGDIVLDMCAAPGGKSTEIGAKLNRTGLLVTNDISNSRAKALLKNIEVFGIGSTLVINEDPRDLVDCYYESFDKIIIDAPCSGEGMFRKDSKLITAWEKNGPKFYNEIQRNIVQYAYKMLKPGGMIMYSTCTFSRLEDEDTIEFILNTFDDLELVDIDGYEGFSKGKFGYDKCVRIFPHKMEGEGHFLALLRKKGEKNDFCPSVKTKYKLPKEVEEFFENVKINLDVNRMFEKNGYLYLLPEKCLEFKKIRSMRTGLLLGEIKKNRFEPSQALAMYLKKEEYPYILDLSLDDERTKKYLKGETLMVSDKEICVDKGWILVCVLGYPLGFGKLANGVLKNKYLPGWRWT